MIRESDLFSYRGSEIFVFTEASTFAVSPTQPPIH